MKKLAIVALALVLAMTVVGCGNAGKELLNTSWKVDWKSGNGSYSLLTFAEDDVVNYVDMDITTVIPSSYTGTWSAVGNTVTIEELVSALNGTWTVLIEEVDDTKTLTLTDVENEERVQEFVLFAEAAE